MEGRARRRAPFRGRARRPSSKSIAQAGNLPASHSYHQHFPEMQEEVSKELFDSPIFLSTPASREFITTVLQPSTEYSIIAKGMDGTVLLRNQGEW